MVLGAEYFTPAMHEFSDFIASLSLIDLPVEGGAFTWSNSHENTLRSRLDIFLLSHDWGEKFLNV